MIIPVVFAETQHLWHGHTVGANGLHDPKFTLDRMRRRKQFARLLKKKCTACTLAHCFLTLKWGASVVLAAVDIRVNLDGGHESATVDFSTVMNEWCEWEAWVHFVMYMYTRAHIIHVLHTMITMERNTANIKHYISPFFFYFLHLLLYSILL